MFTMKRLRISLITFLSSALFLAADPIPASSVRWNLHFGSSEKAPKATLCLMARGYFRMATNPDMPKLVDDWMRDHPKAMVVPVASFGPTIEKEPESRMIYVWIIDGEQNLNLELVRRGCFAPQTQAIGSAQKLEAPKADYDAFIEKAMAAGKEARDKKLGVWKAATE